MKSSSMQFSSNYRDSHGPGDKCGIARDVSENTQHDAGGHCRTNFLAGFQVLSGKALWPQDFFRGLRVRANDDGLRNRPQTPAGCDTFNLLRGTMAVASCANQYCVGPAIESIERGIVSSIEEVLHLSRHRGQIFRSRKNV